MKFYHFKLYSIFFHYFANSTKNCAKYFQCKKRILELTNENKILACTNYLYQHSLLRKLFNQNKENEPNNNVSKCCCFLVSLLPLENLIWFIIFDHEISRPDGNMPYFTVYTLLLREKNMTTQVIFYEKSLIRSGKFVNKCVFVTLTFSQRNTHIYREYVGLSVVKY
jgi:hypothetical protein